MIKGYLLGAYGEIKRQEQAQRRLMDQAKQRQGVGILGTTEERAKWYARAQQNPYYIPLGIEALKPPLYLERFHYEEPTTKPIAPMPPSYRPDKQIKVSYLNIALVAMLIYILFF